MRFLPLAAVALLVASACGSDDPVTNPTTVSASSSSAGGGSASSSSVSSSSSASSSSSSTAASSGSGGGTGGGPVGKPPFICDTTIAVLPGVTTFNGATAASVDHTESQGCGVIGDGAPDLVYALKPAIDGRFTLSLSGEFNKALYVVDDCNGGTEMLCDGDMGDVSLSLDVEASKTYFVVVDGVSGESGGFVLDVELTGCGDGIVNHDEECDDGDSDDADGCTNACEVSCPSGWSEEPTGHHCYRYESSNVDWTTASVNCPAVDDSAHLVTLTTPEEITFVADLINANIWVGGSDLVVEGSWAWVTGEPWLYVNGQVPWRTGEPNNSGNEDCASLEMAGTFDDQDCAMTKRFVCELVPPGL